ncbi:MAG: hypothetical protein V6Z82_01015 [Flavobacteriales bacterium]
MYAAIVGRLREKFNNKVDLIEVYSPLSPTPEVVAMLLALENMAIEQSAGDGRVCALCDFSISALLPVTGYSLEQVSVAASNYAAALLQFIYNNKWGLGKDIGLPESISAQPALFEPGHTGYESWRITWGQSVYLGQYDKGVNFLPDIVKYNASPERGKKHKDNYVRI